MAHRILVVEDDKVVRQDISEALRQNGFDVLEASDGAQARDLLKGHLGVVIQDEQSITPHEAIDAHCLTAVGGSSTGS